MKDRFGETREAGFDYAALQGKLERAVHKVCPDWLRAQEDDLVQVALMRIVDVEKKSEGNHELPSSYLWTVARNAMIDEIRRYRRRGEVSLTDEEEGTVEPPDRTPNPESRTEGSQLAGEIADCLSHLVESRRRAVTLNLQGHTVPEAARLLDWTVKKTENLVYRGLRELRACLEKKGLKP